MSLFGCLDQLLEAGVEVVGVLALTDRKEALENHESFAEKLARLYSGKILYHPLISGPEVVRQALLSQNLDDHLRTAIEQELENAATQLK